MIHPKNSQNIAIGLLLSTDFEANALTLSQDSIVLTASFSFAGMTVLHENGEHKSLDLSPKQLDLSPSLQTSTAVLLLTNDLGKTLATLESGSLVVTVSFGFEDMTLLGDNVVTKDPDLSPTKLFLVVSTSVRLLLTIDSRTTFVQDLIVATALFSFVAITELGDNSSPKQNVSPSVQTSGFMATAGLLLADDLGMIEVTS